MRWRPIRRDMTCDAVAARVTDYLEGALSAPDRARFAHHLDGCDDCRAYVAQFAQTLNALGALRADDAPPEALDALLDAFRAHVGLT
jgi:predicted anti-sigma-YlaC factor YlaD